MQSPTNLPQNVPGSRFDGAGGGLVLLGDRDPVTVKRWAAQWDCDAVRYCLAGPFDFAAELMAALTRLQSSDEDVTISSAALWPLVKATPKGVYIRAAQSVRLFHRNPGLWDTWAYWLAAVGFDLPDWPELMAFREHGKRRGNA